jgi:putative ABC transport system permease protein
MWNGNVKTALSSLRRSKLRSFFTMLGIIIGVSSVVTIVSLGEGLKHQIIGQINDLGSDVVTVRPGRLVTKDKSNKNNFNLLALLTISTLTSGDVGAISHLPAVKTVAPVDFVTNSISSSGKRMDNVFVAGTNPAMASLLHSKIKYGSFFDEEDADQNFAVIGPQIALQLFDETNPIGESMTIDGQNFIVRGVLEPSSTGVLSVAQADFNYAVLIPFQPAVDLAAGHTNILQILVKSTDPKNVDQTINQINAVLQKSHSQQDFSVLKQDELVGAASGVVNVATGFITAIAGISLLVGGIGIMDIMLVSVSERNREIGIRKALGATNRQIMSQFLIEGLALTIGGGLVGLAIAFAVNGLIRIYTSWTPVISLPVIVIAVGFSIIVGVIFSTIPALKAARKDPITALRGD